MRTLDQQTQTEVTTVRGMGNQLVILMADARDLASACRHTAKQLSTYEVDTVPVSIIAEDYLEQLEAMKARLEAVILAAKSL